jgi:hypothetical protein
VDLAARAARARGALEEAVGGGLQREAAQRVAADEHDRLADGLGADRAGHGRRVREPQQVRGEGRVGLERRHEIGRRRVRVVGQRDDPLDGAVEDREVGELVDRVEELVLGLDEDRVTPAGRVRCTHCLHRRMVRPGRDAA